MKLHQESVFFHEDGLKLLNEDISLSEKLTAIYRFVHERAPLVERIAVALYDADTDMLKTFAYASGSANPLPLYEARLADSSSLKEIMTRRQARIVNDTELYGAAAPHARNIRAVFGSSYTLPIFRNGEFIGFLFFNAVEKNAFDATALHFFDLLGHLLALLIIDSLATPKAMIATVRAATGLSYHRDFETGAHVDRVAHYARTSVRPYKSAWSIDEAFQYLIELADSRFDRDCVAALVKNRPAIEEIQARFAEDGIG
jgi:hypothetical protein